uniref:F-box protein At2g02240-like n=1 Tax=Erigeron canadensis TaxID=72917 RepID=UPI001CB8E496|nr:F-box protein At2g02240-like [Erigeron canadensis]
MQHALAAPFYDIRGIFNQTLLKLFSWSSKGKYYMLSATEAIWDSSNTELFNSKSSTESRFREVVELQSTDIFRIKWKILSERLLQNSEYMCYLVFKFSEKCSGLHCPVMVQDLNQRRNKQTRIVYFRTPQTWNMSGDDNQGPKEREDGWMEVNLWKFKTDPNYGCIPINLKLATYEGSMSGLVVCGLEFRPM